jgi:hypothetical protein
MYIACIYLTSQSNSLYRRSKCSFFRPVKVSSTWCVLLPLWRPHISPCERLSCPLLPPDNFSSVSFNSNERQQFKTSRNPWFPLTIDRSLTLLWPLFLILIPFFVTVLFAWYSICYNKTASPTSVAGKGENDVLLLLCDTLCSKKDVATCKYLTQRLIILCVLQWVTYLMNPIWEYRSVVLFISVFIYSTLSVSSEYKYVGRLKELML